MGKKGIISRLIFLSALMSILVLSSCFGAAADFLFNGTVYDPNSNLLNYTNITIVIKDNTWTQVWTNVTNTDANGFFNISLPANEVYMYQLTIVHYNDTGDKFAKYVGKSIPLFPYAEFSALSNVKFYLKNAGTINVTVVNSTGSLTRTTFAYQIKDTQLGYPIASGSATQSNDPAGYQVTAIVPKDRNYSIMVYPAQGSQERFIPVSFDWNNFSSTSSYSLTDGNGAHLSSYNATTNTLHKQFNVTMSTAQVKGYINREGISGWNEFTMIPILLEPGNMISIDYSMLPYNFSSAIEIDKDTHARLTGDMHSLTTGYFNITLPYCRAETVSYLLFAAARNDTLNYGAYKNITSINGDFVFNLTMYGLLGGNSTYNMTYISPPAEGLGHVVNTTKQLFRLVNSSNITLSNANAHIELKLDYSGYNATEFTFMMDLSGANDGNFSVPMLNVTGVKELNVYMSTQAPKRVPTKTAAEVIANNNITMKTFRPKDIDGAIANSGISISLYKSNSSCDVPNPPSSCLLTTTATLDTFNPLSAVIGGGDISFRMGNSGVQVHYVKVDLLASGPPDVEFDDAATSEANFNSAMRFGSAGPSIYSYVLISIPYLEAAGSGLDDSAAVNISLPLFYEDSWTTPIWNTSLNGTVGADFAANFSHFSKHQSEWNVLMNPSTCTTNVLFFNITNPCYIDTTNNRIWIRLPHFSGTSPDITGNPVPSASSSSSSGGSSLSSGLVNPAQYKTFSIINPGVPAIMKITKEETGLKEIKINTNKEVHTVKVTVAKIDSLPSDVSSISTDVYKYLEINKTNLEEDDIESIEISFEVTKDWLDDNNVNKDEVRLKRYSSEWDDLSTTITGEDDDYTFYKAVSPSLSFFAIGVKKAVIEQEPVEEEKPEESITPELIAPVAQPAPSKTWLWITLIVIVAIAALTLLGYYGLRASSEEHHRPVIEIKPTATGIKVNVKQKGIGSRILHGLGIARWKGEKKKE